ncbi:LuxR family transcriptional regulator [Erythrobacter sp. YJ-T3-07]|uniref:response regulator transcription factor n=1 Tax=Erythrobacter sp. YJ-T3-07 TaxID=2793063 RepID=UPI0018D2FB3E|nr:LuxR C-terminal-related transcriptional regulator [Erythrobacter sp. YJ-T3-07]MBH1943180.1 LuxR family transcriptional regulator [Erythrobacter sp. YJ-T3-07]
MDNVFVIDGNGERRAEIGHVLMEGGGHAEPFETIDEFLAFGSNEGTALVGDDDGAAIRLCEKMRDKPRPVPVVGYALSPDIGQVVAAMQAGAVSYLGWPFSRATLTEEMARIAPMVRRTLAEQRRRAHASALLAGLTAREREVLVSLTTLGTNKAIAKQLEISPRTVEKYRAAILVRLGVENSAQAIRIAVEGGAFDAAQSVGSTRGSAARRAGGDVIG